MTNLNTFSPAHHTLVSNSIPPLKKGSHIIVTGAGAFGGWSALNLLRSGYKVTLLDAWGPGNARASSGDETRVIRSTYGANPEYFDMNVRAIELWKENEKRFQKKLFHNTGVLWLCYEERTPLVDDSIPFAKRHRMEYEYLAIAELQKRYPLVNTNDLHHAYFDPYGGYLKAREACQAVKEAFVQEGGQFIQASVVPGAITQGHLQHVLLSNHTTLKADAYLFACGAWLSTLFPDIFRHTITCTRQEVYYFGTPQQEAHAFDNFPVWIDVDGKDFYYGIPGNAHRGFKLGVDIRGEQFDPTNGDHTLDADVLAKARTFIGHRFPALKNAPLVENRVCPYENSPDGNFIFGTHPEAANVYFLGGGSGHGFKHGPALGERIAQAFAG